jgi:hypothetical protein
MPLDLEEAAEAWGANCGPGAIAALIGRPLAAVLSLMPDFPSRGYVNPSHAKRALTAAGWEFVKHEEPGLAGLAFIQWCGPWDFGGANARWAYRYTHWITYRRHGSGELAAYDVNNGDIGGWCWYDQWAEQIAPFLLPKRATGHRIRECIEARPVAVVAAAECRGGCA